MQGGAGQRLLAISLAAINNFSKTTPTVHQGGRTPSERVCSEESAVWGDRALAARHIQPSF